MNFEKIWSYLATGAFALLVVMLLAYTGLALFCSGKTTYCSFQSIPWSEVVDVVEHRNFATDGRYTAPSFEDAMKYAAMACPNFKGGVAR